MLGAQLHRNITKIVYSEWKKYKIKKKITILKQILIYLSWMRQWGCIGLFYTVLLKKKKQKYNRALLCKK